MRFLLKLVMLCMQFSIWSFTIRKDTKKLKSRFDLRAVKCYGTFTITRGTWTRNCSCMHACTVAHSSWKCKTWTLKLEKKCSVMLSSDFIRGFWSCTVETIEIWLLEHLTVTSQQFLAAKRRSCIHDEICTFLTWKKNILNTNSCG